MYKKRNQQAPWKYQVLYMVCGITNGVLGNSLRFYVCTMKQKFQYHGIRQNTMILLQ